MVTRLSAIVALGVVLVLMGITHANMGSTSLSSKQPHDGTLPNLPIATVSGGGAISVSPAKAAFARQTGQPAYTVQDVEAFIAAHPTVFHATLIGTPKITVQFVSVDQSAALVGNSLSGLSNRSQLICLVIFHNEANFGGPYGMKPIISHRAFEIFNAFNGNIYVSGGL